MKRPHLVLLSIAAVMIRSCGPDDGPAHTDIVLSSPEYLTELLVEPGDSLFLVDNPELAGHFELVGSIPLAPEASGDIRFIDFHLDGSIAVVDYRRKVVVLEPDGSLRHVVSSEECDPGYDWKPVQARFTPDGRLMAVSSTIPAVLIFDQSGKCTSELDVGTMLPIDATPLRTNQVAVSYGTPGGIITDIVDFDGTHETLRIHDGQSDFLYRARPQRNLAFVGDRYLFESIYSIPGVFRHDLETESLDYFDLSHDEFRQFTDSQMDVGRRGIQSAISDVLSSYSMTSKLFALDEQHVIVVYRHGYESFSQSDRSMSLDIMHVDGPLINPHPLHFRGYGSNIIGAYEGHLVRVRQGVTGTKLDFYRRVDA